MAAEDYVIRLLQGDEYKEAYERSYPDYPFPKSTVDVMKHRYESAPHLFLGYFVNNTLIAYALATQSEKTRYTEDRIVHHTPNGQTVLLHRLWVHPDHRRKGIATKLFKSFVTNVHDMNPKPNKICLVDDQEHIGFWHRYGFLLRGPSNVYDYYINDSRTYGEMDLTIVPNEKSLNTGVYTTRVLTEEDTIKAWVLEQNGYLSAESASLDTIKYRLQHTPCLQMGYFVEDELIAWISGVQSDQTTLTTDSLVKHVPDGDTVCVHSVCVLKEFRRKGIASTLLKAYIEHIKELKPRPVRICLVAHDYLIPFYTRMGFQSTGPSEFQWANEEWIGLEYSLQ